MTTQADIKLVIDQLDAVASANLFDRLSIKAATVTLETLGNQVAAQAAVIEKLQGLCILLALSIDNPKKPQNMRVIGLHAFCLL